MSNLVPRREAISRGDTDLIRASPGEVVLPPSLSDNPLIHALLLAQGHDPKARTVGTPRHGPRIKESGREAFFEGAEGVGADDSPGEEGDEGDSVGSESFDAESFDAEFGDFGDIGAADFAAVMADAGVSAGEAGFGIDAETLGELFGTPTTPGQIDSLPETVEQPGGVNVGTVVGVLGNLAVGNVPGALASLGMGLGQQALGIPAGVEFNPETFEFSSPAFNSLADAIANPGQAIGGLEDALSDFVDSYEPGDPGPTAGSGEAIPEQFIQAVVNEHFGPDVATAIGNQESFNPAEIIPGLDQEFLDLLANAPASDFLVPRHSALETRFEEHGANEGEYVDNYYLTGLDPFEPLRPPLSDSGAEHEDDYLLTERNISPQEFSARHNANVARGNEIARIEADLGLRNTGYEEALAAIDSILNERGIAGRGLGIPARNVAQFAANKFPINTGADVSQFIGPDVGTLLINQALSNATDRRRQEFTEQANELFSSPFDLTFDDDIISRILDNEFSNASQQISNQVARGNFNPTGVQLATEELNRQRPEAQARLNEVADSILRGRLDEFGSTVHQPALAHAQTFELGQDDFNFDPFIEQADRFKADTLSSTEPSVRGNLGLESLFDVRQATQLGGQGQGLVSGGPVRIGAPPIKGTGAGQRQEGQQELLSAIANRDTARPSERRIASSGTGRF